MSPVQADADAQAPITPAAAITVVRPARPRGRRVRWIIGLIVLPIVLCLALGGLRATFSLYRHGGDGMLPTLANRDMLLVDRRDLTIERPPSRGDLVLFDPPIRSGSNYMKRVIGLPGETIAIRDGKVYINGIPLDEPYVQARIQYRYPAGSQTSEIIPAGTIFVLGDNRNNSADSHAFGAIALGTIKGRVAVIRPVSGGWPRRP